MSEELQPRVPGLLAGGKAASGERKPRVLSSRGSVTAELAVVLPALTVILGLLLVCAVAGVTELRLEEAARSAARSLARGDAVASALAGARRIAGNGAQVAVSYDGGFVQVQVAARISGPLAGLISWPLTAVAVAKLEVVREAAGATGPPPGRPP